MLDFAVRQNLSSMWKIGLETTIATGLNSLGFNKYCNISKTTFYHKSSSCLFDEGFFGLNRGVRDRENYGVQDWSNNFWFNRKYKLWK